MSAAFKSGFLRERDLELIRQAGLDGQGAPEIHLSLIPQCCILMWVLGESNSGPRACEGITVSSEPSPQSRRSFLKKY